MGHFYEKLEDGSVEPRHFVEMSSKPGVMRGTRVTDVRKWQKDGRHVCPSVTTVMNVLDKPGLNTWRVDEHLKTAYESYTKCKSFDEYKKVIKDETQERLDAAPKAGTDFHQVLEDYFGKNIIPESPLHQRICESVRDVIKENCGEHEFICEEYFVSNLGYAGCADLRYGEWIIDYKTKQGADKFKPGRMAFPDHSRQLAAYGQALIGDHQTDMDQPGNGFKAANIFICLENGEVDFHEHSQKELENGWQDFVDCLSIYFRNVFNPFA